MTNRQKQYNQAIKKCNALTNKAKQERDTLGYRENLGYDSENKLYDFVEGLDALTYQDKTQIYKNFYKICDNI